MPAYLDRRGQQGTAANRPYNFVGYDSYPDDEYLSTICIGTPGQELTVDLDTGSSDLWVLPYTERYLCSSCEQGVAANVFTTRWVYSPETPLDDGRNNHTYYNASKSLTSKKLDGYNWTITYGDGSSAFGDVYTDTVTFADITFPRQAVEAAKFVSPDFVPDPRFDGYFGVGHNAGNQGQPQDYSSFHG